MAHDVLSSLMSFVKGFKLIGKGWKYTGKDAGTAIAADMRRIGNTVKASPERLWAKGSSYMQDLSTLSRQKGNPIIGGAAVAGKLGYDAVHGTIDLAANAVGSGVGLAVGLPLMAVTGSARLTGRLIHGVGKAGGYSVLKQTGKGLAAGGLLAAKSGAGGLAMESANALVGMKNTAKFIWNMRNNKTFQRAAFLSIVGGSLAYGGMEGIHEAGTGTTLPYDPYNSTFTNPQDIRNPQYANVPGQRPMRKIDDFGATGDLVFAMNNLRSKGMF